MAAHDTGNNTLFLYISGHTHITLFAISSLHYVYTETINFQLNIPQN